MKVLLKASLFTLIAVTALFVARGSGHVPRQMLLISGNPEILQSAVPVVALVPAPQPVMPRVGPDPMVAWAPAMSFLSFSDPMLTSLGDRSPPASVRSLQS